MEQAGKTRIKAVAAAKVTLMTVTMTMVMEHLSLRMADRNIPVDRRGPSGFAAS